LWDQQAEMHGQDREQQSGRPPRHVHDHHGDAAAQPDAAGDDQLVGRVPECRAGRLVRVGGHDGADHQRVVHQPVQEPGAHQRQQSERAVHHRRVQRLARHERREHQAGGRTAEDDRAGGERLAVGERPAAEHHVPLVQEADHDEGHEQGRRQQHQPGEEPGGLHVHVRAALGRHLAHPFDTAGRFEVNNAPDSQDAEPEPGLCGDR
jgi:hypothetical protein